MVSENDAVARTSTITGLSSIREVTQSYVLLNTSRWTPTAIFSEIGGVVWCTTRVEVARVVVVEKLCFPPELRRPSTDQ